MKSGIIFVLILLFSRLDSRVIQIKRMTIMHTTSKAERRWLWVLLMFGLAACQAAEPPKPDFTAIEDVRERKAAFFAYLRPLAERANASVLKDRARLLAIQAEGSDVGWWDRRTLKRLANDYGVDSSDVAGLLSRVDAVPVSLLLAQAANESSWGRSRFAREGNAFFGQWCFTPGCGMVPKGRPAGQTYEVRSFRTVSASVEAYVRNLNTGDAYQGLRDIRARQRAKLSEPKGVALAEGLTSYSTRGAEYVSEIQSMIRYNELGRFDAVDKACGHSPLPDRC
jgi:Bax protein